MNDEQKARAGLFKSMSVLTWVLVGLLAVPVLGCGGCCLFSMVSSAARGGVEATR